MRRPAHPRGTGPRARTSTHHPRPSRAYPGPTHPTGPAGVRPRGQTTRTPPRPTRSIRPIPATVWLCGAADAPCPASVLAKVITAFTDPGAHVVLLAWPRLGPTTPEPDAHSAARAVPVEPVHRLTAALHVARDLGRIAHLIHSTLGPGDSPSASRSHRADLADDPSVNDGTGTAPSGTPSPAPAPSSLDTGTGADLVVTSTGPEHADDRACEHIAAAAAAQLRTGGVLAVLTHSDWSGGTLVDPTGPIVAAAQNADLLYLQHIVLIHAPVRDNHFAIHPPSPTEDDRRPGHPAPTSTAHRRIHTDLLAFAQPRDHHPQPLLPAAVASPTATAG